MTPIAQTYPQLAVQLSGTDWGAADLALVRRAYDLAAELFAGAVRGSGKPFIDHLVGTSSGVLLGGGTAESAAAALLHAAYEFGDFGDGRTGPTAQHRRRLSAAVGDGVERLVYDYHHLRWVTPPLAESLDATDRRVLLIRVANEIDDALDRGLLLSGKGRLREHHPSVHVLDVKLAERIATPALAAVAADVLLSPPTPLPPELIVGEVRSRTHLPASAKYRLRPRLVRTGLRGVQRAKAILNRVRARR